MEHCNLINGLPSFHITSLNRPIIQFNLPSEKTVAKIHQKSSICEIEIHLKKLLLVLNIESNFLFNPIESRERLKENYYSGHGSRSKALLRIFLLHAFLLLASAFNATTTKFSLSTFFLIFRFQVNCA